MFLNKLLRLWKHLEAFMFLVAHDHVLKKASNCKNNNEKLDKKLCYPLVLDAVQLE